MAGGRRAAAMYSLIESAKLNGLNPQLYLADLLARIADHPARHIAELLPWNCAGPCTGLCRPPRAELTLFHLEQGAMTLSWPDEPTRSIARSACSIASDCPLPHAAVLAQQRRQPLAEEAAVIGGVAAGVLAQLRAVHRLAKRGDGDKVDHRLAIAARDAR